jgi:general secretion pathway protein D
MLAFNRLAVIVAALVLAFFAEARTRKGDKLLAEGRAAELKQEFEKALELLEKAWAEDPTDAAYQMAVRRVRFQAGTRRIGEGQRLREEGKLEEALAEFQKAYSIDPASTIAVQEIRRTRAMIERERRRGKEAPPEERALTPAQQARKEVEERAASLLPVPELKPISRQITSLRMTNQPVRVLFETLGKLAGINVIMDTEYQTTGRNYSVDLTNTTIEDALEHLSVLTKSFWKPLSPNTIFVTNENVTKRRDYEDWVAKVFYITNTTQPQELNEISTAVRAVTNLRQVFVYAAQNAIIVRGTVDQVALAEKLFLDLDKPRSEVVVDVIVMEANRSRTRDLAATIQSGGVSGFRVPIAFSPRESITTGTEGAIVLDSVGKINTQDFSLTLPSGLLQALMSDRGTRVLQSPQLRAADGVKSSLKIGDRFPYAVGSFQPGIGGAGLNPLVSTQFQFADVGVNVDITPKIHGTDEVSMQVDIDISNVRDTIDVGGLKQPIIGQRKLSHAVRLREGEVSLLGGLMQDQDTKTQSGVPGLGQIPILRRLFSSENIEKNQSELLIALVPHILRGQELTDVNLRSVASGADQTVKLSYAPRREPPPEPTPSPPKPPPTPSPPEAPPAEEPKPAEPPKPESPKPEEAKPPPPKPEPGSTRLFFAPVAVETSLGTTVSISIQVDAATDLFSAPIRLKFDPKFLRLNEVLRGAMFSADGQQPIFTRNIRNDTGEAIITHSRLPGSPGLSGAGTLVTLVFQTVGRGSTSIQLTELNLTNSKMQPITVAPPPLAVEIR